MFRIATTADTRSAGSEIFTTFLLNFQLTQVTLRQGKVRNDDLTQVVVREGETVH